MNLLFSIVPILMLVVSYFIKCLINDGFLIYSIYSVVFFTFVFTLSNILNFKNIKYGILSIILYVSYDAVLLFAIGVNVISFSIASLLFYLFKQLYDDDLSFFQYLIVFVCFFLLSQSINYFFIGFINFKVLVLQLVMSCFITAIINFLFVSKNKFQRDMMSFN